MAIKVAMLGMGRMGQEIVRKISEDPELELVAAIDVNPDLIGKDAGALAGISPLGVNVESPESLSEILDRAKPEIAVDFSSAKACLENSKTVCEHGIGLVIGTTGLAEEEIAEIHSRINGNNCGAVISPNMSVGVNVFWDLVREATRLLPDYDIEITETHHRFKKDSPSGTAKRTAEIIAKVLEKNLEESAVYGREGLQERKPGEIGIHAIRAGDIVGEHTVLFGTLGERVEITHRAHSRGAFSNGAIKAIHFIHGKTGIHGMDNVLGLK